VTLSAVLSAPGLILIEQGFHASKSRTLCCTTKTVTGDLLHCL
jgi:hypothetical protein